MPDTTALAPRRYADIGIRFADLVEATDTYGQALLAGLVATVRKQDYANADRYVAALENHTGVPA